MMRLNKYLSECGIASRRKAEEYILQGRISVDGKVVIDLGTKVNPEKNRITLDGENIKPEKKIYFLLNKPRGIITTTKDDKHRKTVVELINTSSAIFPVGRLDFQTTGFLLLTNDGDFTNFILHPSNKIEREYVAMLNKPLSIEDRLKMLKGIYLDRKRSKFHDISFPEKGNFKKVKVTTTEGRNHFVKRMFEHFDYFVKKLDRQSFGGWDLGNLNRGEYIQIPEKEINKFTIRLKKKISK